MLGRPPLGPARLRPPLFSTDQIETETVWSARIRLIHRARLLPRLENAIIKRAQVGYKRDYDKKVLLEPSSAAGDSVFVDQPPLKTTSSKKPASEGYKKLLAPCPVPYLVLSIGLELIRIFENGIENMVSINHISLVFREGDTCDTKIL